MKMNLRFLSALFVLIMSVSVFAACGNIEAPEGSGVTVPKADTETVAPSASEGVTDESVPFVAPPDAVGVVVSADNQLVTWHPYTIEETTIDFKNLDVDALGVPGEMALYYLEEDVSYYTLVNGKLEKITVEEIISGSVIGITTLEEGVQEVVVIFTPEVDDGSDDMEDPLEEITEDTLPDENATTVSPDEDYENPPVDEEELPDDGV